MRSLYGSDTDREVELPSGMVSRYDPQTMNRITSLGDLIDDSSDESDDGAIGHSSSLGTTGVDFGNEQQAQTKYCLGGVGNALFCRQTIVIISLIGIIFGASFAIGYTVISNGQPLSKRGQPSYSVAEENVIPEQHLLEIAERVITACSESSLDSDMTECQNLCHSRMCCFGSGEYSCKDDESKACAVHAGCEALMEGIPMEALEEDED